MSYKHSAFPEARFCAKQPGGAVFYFFDEQKRELGWAIDEKVFLRFEKPRLWDEGFLETMEWSKLE